MRAAIIGALLALAPASGTAAQATTYVDPLDDSYADVAALVAGGVVDRVIVGQRPYTRLEFARIVGQATRALARRDSLSARTAYLRQVVASIADRLCLEPDTSAAPRVRPCTMLHSFYLRRIALDYTQTDSPTRRIPPSNGIGQIDAFLNPLLSGRLGRPLVPTWNVSLETEHVVETPHLALALTTALIVQADTSRAQRVLGRVQDAQLRFVAKNVAIEAGREYALWGQSETGGLLGSISGPPLDLVRISNERLLTLPWLLRNLGPTKLSAFYSDLGGAQNYPHPYLVGYKISIAPSERVELGFVTYTKSGGHGSPRASFGARVLDAFPFVNASFFAGIIGLRGAYQFSDRYAGTDGRLRFPSLRSSELFWEILLNDFDVRRLGSVLWEDAGHVVGFTMPRLTDDGRLSGSLEYHHTGIRYYEHHQFTSGQTLRGTLLGDPLGPDASGGYANLRWVPSPRDRVTLTGALERRSHDEYELLPLPPPQFRFSKTLDRPKEWRTRAVATWRRFGAGGFGTLAELGYEHVRNYDFAAGVERDNWAARAGVEYRLR